MSHRSPFYGYDDTRFQCHPYSEWLLYKCTLVAAKDNRAPQRGSDPFITISVCVHEQNHADQ